MHAGRRLPLLSVGSHIVAARFRTTVRLEGKTATMFEVPLDVKALFGRKRPPVRVTINDHTYRSTIAVYDDRNYLPLNKHNRAAAGVEAGDEVEVTLELDDEPREVDVPQDFANALQQRPEAMRAFTGMSYSHQREYVEHILEAKRSETRLRRIERSIEKLCEGRTQR